MDSITLPYFQQALARRTSVRDLLVANCAWPVELVIDDHSLKHAYPGLTPVGLIGFDTHQQRFVLLKMGGPKNRIRADPGLSEREQEVLQWVAAGSSNTQIARRLVISENTVKVHLRRIFEKLQVQSRTEAAMYAVREGWVSVTEAVKPI